MVTCFLSSFIAGWNDVVGSIPTTDRNAVALNEIPRREGWGLVFGEPSVFGKPTPRQVAEASDILMDGLNHTPEFSKSSCKGRGIGI